MTRQFHIGAQNDALFIISGERPATTNDYPRHDADRTCIAKVYDEAEARRLVNAANAGLASAPQQAQETSLPPQGAWHGARIKRTVHPDGSESHETLDHGVWRQAEPAQEMTDERISDLMGWNVEAMQQNEPEDLPTRVRALVRVAEAEAVAADRASRLPEHDRNMDGAREFIDAILMNQPMWPNPWGQDVAAAAFFLTDGGKRDRWQAKRLPEMGEDDWPELPKPAIAPFEADGRISILQSHYTAAQLRAAQVAAVEKYKALVRRNT